MTKHAAFFQTFDLIDTTCFGLYSSERSFVPWLAHCFFPLLNLIKLLAFCIFTQRAEIFVDCRALGCVALSLEVSYYAKITWTALLVRKHRESMVEKCFSTAWEAVFQLILLKRQKQNKTRLFILPWRFVLYPMNIKLRQFQPRKISRPHIGIILQTATARSVDGS